MQKPVLLSTRDIQVMVYANLVVTDGQATTEFTPERQPPGLTAMWEGNVNSRQRARVYSTGVLEYCIAQGYSVYITTTRSQLEEFDAWWQNLLPGTSVVQPSAISTATLKKLTDWDDHIDGYIPDDVVLTPTTSIIAEGFARVHALEELLEKDPSFLWRRLFGHLNLEWPEMDFGAGLEEVCWEEAVDQLHPNKLLLAGDIQEELRLYYN